MYHCSKQLITAVTLRTLWNCKVLMSQQIRQYFQFSMWQIAFEKRLEDLVMEYGAFQLLKSITA